VHQTNPQNDDQHKYKPPKRFSPPADYEHVCPKPTTPSHSQTNHTSVARPSRNPRTLKKKKKGLQLSPLASPPLDGNDELGLDVDGVVVDDTLSIAVARVVDADLGVDVESGIGATRSPDNGGGGDLVVDQEVARLGAIPGSLGGHLLLLAGEVVGGFMDSLDSLVDIDETTVIGGDDGVLEAAGVAEGDVQLAVASGLSGGDSGAGLSVVGIEEDGDSLPRVGDRDGSGVLRTSVTTVGDIFDVDGVPVGLVGDSALNNGTGQDGSEKSGEDNLGEQHFDDCL
jgi:hypothetical protein